MTLHPDELAAMADADEALDALRAERLELRRRLALVEEEILLGALRRLGPPALDPGRDGDSSLGDLKDWMARQFEAMGDRLGAIERAVAEGPGATSPAAPGLPVPDEGRRWEVTIFGADLAGLPDLEADRRALLADLLDGDPAARALVGQLLVFGAAPGAQKPQLLKDLGEAYYRWRPKGPGPDGPMEVALAAALERSCEEAGVRRKIELVRPGARFHAAYHRASEKGVEIAEVHGWVILREDGTVYQKASVAVR